MLDKFLEIDKSWTLFLDLDGVTNEKRENDYVKYWEEFHFVCGSLKAISILSNYFGKIIVVTNQRGVGRGLMKEEDLISIHGKMLDKISLNSGKIDGIYYCIDLSENSFFRKPNPGMGFNAQIDFPEIDFKKSVIVGDSLSDMNFGEILGMYKVLIYNGQSACESGRKYYTCLSLLDFSLKLKTKSLIEPNKWN